MNQLKFLLLLILTTILYSKELQLNNQSSVVFASLQEGQVVLGTNDDFVSRMSEFDRSSRLKTNLLVTTDEYLEFVKNNIQDWTAPEIVRITKIVEAIRYRINELQIPLPSQIVFIKTTGKEEGNAPYTRSNAIIIPSSELKKSDDIIQKTICHEFFHIITRSNSELKNRMYESIGFYKYDELVFPNLLQKRKITNPDAPINNYCIKVNFSGKEEWVIPILFSKSDKYNVQVGGEFFNYLQFVLFIVEPDQNSKLLYDNENLKVISLNQVTGFFEQVGRNTEYIIHPEEILADNFAYLMLEKTDLPNYEVVNSIKQIFLEHKTMSLKAK